MTDRAEIERLLINGRTPEEIKAAVLCTERGTIPDCENCPYCGIVDEQGFRSFACYQAEFDLIAYVERLEAKQPKWISVKERLPKDGELVLITMNGEIDGYKQFDHAYELAYYWSEGEDEDGEYHVAEWALGCWIVVSEWETKGIPVLIGVRAGKIDGVNLKPDTWYKLENGEFVEAEDEGE